MWWAACGRRFDRQCVAIEMIPWCSGQPVAGEQSLCTKAASPEVPLQTSGLWMPPAVKQSSGVS